MEADNQLFNNISVIGILKLNDRLIGESVQHYYNKIKYSNKVLLGISCGYSDKNKVLSKHSNISQKSQVSTLSTL